MKTAKKTTFSARPTHGKGSKKRWLIVGLVILALLLIGGGYAYLQSKNNKSQIPDTSDNQDNTNSTDNTTDEGSSLKEEAAPVAPNNADVTLPPENKPSLQIKAFSQQNGTVNVVVTTTQVGGSGTCVVSFTNPDDRPVVREVAGDGTQCSVSIPEVEFAKTGIWGLNVRYIKGETKVAESNQNVTIN